MFIVFIYRWRGDKKIIKRIEEQLVWIFTGWSIEIIFIDWMVEISRSLFERIFSQKIDEPDLVLLVKYKWF